MAKEQSLAREVHAQEGTSTGVDEDDATVYYPEPDAEVWGKLQCQSTDLDLDDIQIDTRKTCWFLFGVHKTTSIKTQACRSKEQTSAYDLIDDVEDTELATALCSRMAPQPSKPAEVPPKVPAEVPVATPCRSKVVAPSPSPPASEQTITPSGHRGARTLRQTPDEGSSYSTPRSVTPPVAHAKSEVTIPEMGDKTVDSPVAGELRLSEAAVDARLRRLMRPNAHGQFKVSLDIRNQFFCKGKAKKNLLSLFQACGFDTDSGADLVWDLGVLS